MKMRYILPVLLAGVFVAGFGLVHTSHTLAQTPSASGLADYIIVLRDTTPDADGEVDRIERSQQFRARFRFRTALRGFSATLTPAQVQYIQRLPEVQMVSPDREVHATDLVPAASGDTVPVGVTRIQAAGGGSVHEAANANVAVIDTGVGPHPDINVVSGKNCTSTTDPSTSDQNGHGTHVAGTIAGRNNGSGVVGVAPGTKIYAVKVLDAQGSGTWSQVVCGIDWVAQNASALNIKVANMSLGGGGSNDNNCGNTIPDAMHVAICRARSAGVTFVVAAGNDGADMRNFVPAAYPEVLSVTAMADSDGRGGALGGSPSCWAGQADDARASFSNYATSSTEMNHTIAAPGVCIRSSWLSGGFNTISGTSMASPHVAGSVALCLGDGGDPGPCAGMSPAQIIQKMRSDAAAQPSSNGFRGDPNDPVSGRYYGFLVANPFTAPKPDFSISASPTSRTVTPGTSASYTLTLTGLNSFNSPVNLSVTGNPSNSTTSFTTSPVTPTAGGASTTLTVATTGATPGGSSTLNVTATDGTTSHSTSVTLVVNRPDFTISSSPTARSLTAGTSTTYTINLGSQNGYATPVNLAVSGLPANASGTFSINPRTPTSGGVTSVLTVTTASNTPTGSFNLTVTGTDGTLTHTVPITLTVNAVPVSDFTMSVSPTSTTLRRGRSASASFTVTLRSTNGYNLPATFAVTGLGTGMAATWSPTSVTPSSGGRSSTLRITANSSATLGSRTLTIQATGSDGKVKTTTVSINVTR